MAYGVCACQAANNASNVDCGNRDNEQENPMRVNKAVNVFIVNVIFSVAMLSKQAFAGDVAAEQGAATPPAKTADQHEAAAKAATDRAAAYRQMASDSRQAAAAVSASGGKAHAEVTRSDVAANVRAHDLGRAALADGMANKADKLAAVHASEAKQIRAADAAPAPSAPVRAPKASGR
jgi:hypothetical protein